MKHLLFSAVALLLLTGCGDPSGGPDRPPKPFFIKLFGFRHDIRTVTISVPALKSAECIPVIQEALGRAEGVLETKGDIQAKTVEVRYDALKLGIKNLEYVIAGAGFNAGSTPASPEAMAALPAACR